MGLRYPHDRFMPAPGSPRVIGLATERSLPLATRGAVTGARQAPSVVAAPRVMGSKKSCRRDEGCLRCCSGPSVRGCIHSDRSETSRVRLAASRGELARRRPRGLSPARKLHRRGGPVLLCGAGPCAEPAAGGWTVRGTASGRWRRRRANRLWAVRHRSGRWFPAAVRRCSRCR